MDPVRERPHGVEVRHIDGAEVHDLPARPPQVEYRFLESLFVQVGEKEPSSLRGQSQRGSAADAARGAGDQAVFSVQIAHLEAMVYVTYTMCQEERAAALGRLGGGG